MESEEDNSTSTDVAAGTMKEAKEWIGRSGDTFFAAEPVNRSMIRFYAGLVQDGNPSYWDERFANEQWGGICSPPGLLWTWKMDPEWTPKSNDTNKDDVSVTDVPLPGGKDAIINTQSKTTFHRPLLEGTILNWQTEIESVSEEKDTRVGPGHFVSEKTTYRNQSGELIAEESNVMLRYNSPDETDEDTGHDFDSPVADGRRSVPVENNQQPSDRYESLSVENVSSGESLSGFEFPVTYKNVIYNAAATRDFSRHHHDPEYTRKRGNETIFLNTMTLQGIVDRAALQWAGPEWRIREREIAMSGTAIAGDKLDVSGEVDAVDEVKSEIDLTFSLETDGHNICPSSVSIVRDTNY